MSLGHKVTSVQVQVWAIVLLCPKISTNKSSEVLILVGHYIILSLPTTHYIFFSFIL